jgi:hypothetical protein
MMRVKREWGYWACQVVGWGSYSVAGFVQVAWMTVIGGMIGFGRCARSRSVR